MTTAVTAAAAANRHPAPGSDVPGAPPALRRPLTADDGVPAPVAPGPPPLAAPADGSSAQDRRPVALASAAVTVVAAVVAWRRRRANTASARPHASTQETS